MSAGRAAEADELTSATVVLLARYGAVPQVARFSSASAQFRRGAGIVVETERGLEIATVLEQVPAKPDLPLTGQVIRGATPDDLAAEQQAAQDAAAQFSGWIRRVRAWQLQLELIDLEWTLDRRLILYVLNDRGAETTRLALLAAAQGDGTVHVQPVTASGVVSASPGGCGSGSGCGSGGCHTTHT